MSRNSTPRAAPTPPASARTRLPASGSSRAPAASPSAARTSPTYFARPVLQMVLQQPIIAANRAGQYDIVATVAGGGLSGQAGAVRHGISKALTYYEPSLRSRSQEGRLPDPRQPRRRAQEVRQGEGPPVVPVLQALSFNNIANHCGRGFGPVFLCLQTGHDAGAPCRSGAALFGGAGCRPDGLAQGRLWPAQ
jgi:hypothetical protein